ncbi:MAG TPA: polyribonucleotide nucleotidyltransferase, partial [Candidatus Paceibacterota bacterium]|nr:polyribonucleotide nucleotidyltransferase [Candidatus Paceibacterota bacterium]
MEPKIFSTSVAGKTLTAEFTTLAERAHGSCLVRFGDSAVLATAVMGSEKPGTDFVPLTVDYEEKFYAAGAILGSRFLRREGRPSDHAILSARAIDRTLRPLFPKSLRREVQVILTVLAVGEDDPDMLSVIAASIALGTSPIPWNGPISAVRVSGENFNPTYKEREGATFDLFVCGTGETITMVEMSGQEIGEERIASALERALPELAKLQEFQGGIVREMGKEKIALVEKSFSPALAELFNTFTSELQSVLFEKEREE